MLIQYPTVSAAEADQTHDEGMLTLAGLAIEHATAQLFSSPMSLCAKGNYTSMLCLYLYLYAFDTWCEDGCNPWLCQEEYIAIVGKIQELQQGCCDFRIAGTSSSMATTIPASSGGGSSSTTPTQKNTYILEFNVSLAQDGLTTISDPRFAGVKVEVIRALLPLPGIVQENDNMYFTKPLASDTITFSHGLVEKEYIKITTIPH